MSQLRLFHIVLSIGAVLVTLALGGLRSIGPAATGSVPVLLTYILLGFAGMMILGSATFRIQIPAARSGDSIDDWAEANKGKCIVLWAMLEGATFICGVALFLGASPWIAGALAAGALGFLMSQSPGTVAGH